MKTVKLGQSLPANQNSPNAYGHALVLAISSTKPNLPLNHQYVPSLQRFVLNHP
jgi:hypothetical protein